jgi:aminoglycoside phosphotransferase (APT) family kinase protein
MSALQDQLQAQLRDQGLRATVHALAPLVGGACQENFQVDLELQGERMRAVLRGDAASSLPGSIPRRIEAQVVQAAAAAGVPTPRVLAVAPGILGPGRDAYLMPWVEGQAIARRVLKHPSLAGARETICHDLAAALAAIHTVTPDAAELELVGADPSPHTVAVSFVGDMLSKLPEPRPGLELALSWARRNAPTSGEVTLVHGDFRTGNFMVAPQGFQAVLDWEFAHWGDPMDDIGWLCVRDWRFGRLDHAAGGLAKRAAFYAAYEAASGRTVDPARVHWWEIVGNLRWGAAAVFQGQRYLTGKSSDLELLAIPRRVCEMEYEALRLIEKGP